MGVHVCDKISKFTGLKLSKRARTKNAHSMNQKHVDGE